MQRYLLSLGVHFLFDVLFCTVIIAHKYALILIVHVCTSVWTLEEELSAVREERDSQVKQLRSKMEQNAKSLQHQYSIQEAKVSPPLYTGHTKRDYRVM